MSKFILAACLPIALMLNGPLQAQDTHWKYFRASNTGVSGDYHHVIEVDAFNNKWTGGYLPFWSDGSLVRYNDTTWTCWSNFEGYLPNDRVNAIAFDKLGRVWAGTDEGIAMYDGTEWHTYTSANTPMPVDRIYGIAVDTLNRIWATYGSPVEIEGGVARFDGVEWVLFNSDNSGLATSEVFDIGIAPDQHVWLGTNVGIIEFDGLNWITYNVVNSELTADDIQSLCVDTEGKVWAGTNSAVDVWDGTAWTHYNTANSPIDLGADIFDIAVFGDRFLFGASVPLGPNTMVINDGGDWDEILTPNWPISVAIDSTGDFWSAGIGYVGKYDGSTFTSYTRYNTGLAENFNEDLFIDSQNRKWFANGNGGIQMFDCPIWEAYGPWNEFHYPVPVDYTTIGTATTEDAFGDIWMAYDGTYGAVVQIPGGDVHDPAAWTVWEIDNSGVNLQFATHLAADPAGNVFVGLDGGGVSIYWRDSGTWENLNTGNSDLVTGYIQDIATTDAAGVLWIANYVLQKYDNGVWTTIDHADLGISNSESILCVTPDSSGNIWIGTTAGLFKYDGTSFTNWNMGNSAIVADPVFDIALGPGDTMYVAAFNVYTWPYYGGFSIFDGEVFESFTDATSPLAHKQTTDIETDADGNIWLLTQSEGFTVYNPHGLSGFDCIDTDLQLPVDTTVIDTNTTEIFTPGPGIGLQVHPNPVIDQAMLQLQLSSADRVQVLIMDVHGRIVQVVNDHYMSAGTYSIALDMRHFSPGMYFCTVYTEESSSTITIVKQ